MDADLRQQTPHQLFGAELSKQFTNSSQKRTVIRASIYKYIVNLQVKFMSQITSFYNFYLRVS